MKANLFDYIIGDLYYRLVLRANAANYPKEGYPVTRNTVVARRNYDPDLMDWARDQEMDFLIPDSIQVDNYTHLMDGEGRFHTEDPGASSLHCGILQLYWFNEKGMVGREDGPAKVSIANLSQWHQHGIPHRLYNDREHEAIRCSALRVEWIKDDGTQERESGPEMLKFQDVKLEFHEGRISGVSVGRIQYTWTIDGVTLDRISVEKIVAKFGFKLNLLSLDSVFANETDEFNFYNELVTEGE